MAEYSDLDDRLEEQLTRTARFVKAAFHVHSIDSYDWGKEADPATQQAGSLHRPRRPRTLP